MTNLGIAMAPDTLYKLAPPLIALQFAAFGWRVNREINLGDDGRAIWIPIADVLNIMSLLAAVICLIMVPIATDSYFWLSRMVLGAGYVLPSIRSPWQRTTAFGAERVKTNMSQTGKTIRMRRVRSLFHRYSPLSSRS